MIPFGNLSQQKEQVSPFLFLFPSFFPPFSENSTSQNKQISQFNISFLPFSSLSSLSTFSSLPSLSSLPSTHTDEDFIFKQVHPDDIAKVQKMKSVPPKFGQVGGNEVEMDCSGPVFGMPLDVIMIDQVFFIIYFCVI